MFGVGLVFVTNNRFTKRSDFLAGTEHRKYYFIFLAKKTKTSKKSEKKNKKGRSFFFFFLSLFLPDKKTFEENIFSVLR